MLLEHYKVMMETFRHHTDIYLKAFALYLAIIGTSAGFAFSEGAAERRTVLLAFLSGVSVLSVLANAVVFRSGNQVEVRLKQLREQLGVDPWPLAPVRTLVALIMAFSAVVAVAAGWLARP
ncbi:MAG: hypothetical protein D6701_12185 [Gemmatimonadetes bacterium]|nr:MAG: hypothetical protein D6701_12185 [Gemmatimonadota bacterium]